MGAWCTLKRYTGVVLAALGFLVARPLYARPIDKPAFRVWQIVGALVTDHSRPKRLKGDQLRMVLEAARDQARITSRQAGAYALAFAPGAEAEEELGRLVRDASGRLHETAVFARLLRDSLSLAPDERRELLLRALESSTDTPWTRTLLVNWLACEYGPKMWPVFVAALGKERVPMVRMEYLYHLANASDDWHMDFALSVLEDEPNWGPDEGSAFILGTITPGRSRRLLDNGSFRLFVELASRRGREDLIQARREFRFEFE